MTNLSLYNTSILNKAALTAVDFMSSNIASYNVELLSKIVVNTTDYIELNIGSYCIEILHKSSNSAVSNNLFTEQFKFEGYTLESGSAVSRKLVAFNQNSLLCEGTATSSGNGFFKLPTSYSGTQFITCFDEGSSLSYNALIAAATLPVDRGLYGFDKDAPAISAKDLLDYYGNLEDGYYWLKPPNYSEPVQVYCDMHTLGGGWTLCARWDRDFYDGVIKCLPLDALRSNINSTDMRFLSLEGSYQSATIDIRPFIAIGATHLLHAAADEFGALSNVFVSEIYQEVIINPNNIFDITYDTNDGEGITGSVINFSEELKNRWFDHKFNPLSSINSNGESSDFRLNGGEGSAMFTCGSNSGACYSSHNYTDCMSTLSPYVFWGFYGKDGSLPSESYSVANKVGTYLGSNYPPEKRFNFMFIR